MALSDWAVRDLQLQAQKVCGGLSQGKQYVNRFAAAILSLCEEREASRAKIASLQKQLADAQVRNEALAERLKRAETDIPTEKEKEEGSLYQSVFGEKNSLFSRIFG